MRRHDDDLELRNRLTPMQYHVTQEAGTEPAFTGEYFDEHDAGTYRCIVCDAPLFASNTKYDSGTGWPSFWAPIAEGSVTNKLDFKLIVPRTEVTCSNCGAHLGHVFSDGPDPTGQRYCMNSASLHLDRESSPE